MSEYEGIAVFEIRQYFFALHAIDGNFLSFSAHVKISFLMLLHISLLLSYIRNYAFFYPACFVCLEFFLAFEFIILISSDLFGVPRKCPR